MPRASALAPWTAQEHVCNRLGGKPLQMSVALFQGSAVIQTDMRCSTYPFHSYS